MSRVLLRCGVVAGPLFTATHLVEGLLRPGHRPARHPVSSLALGPGGWVQRCSFWVTGVLYLAGAVGLARTRERGRRLVPSLVGSVAVGLLGAGAFPTDPISGYPPGTPDVPTTRTTRGVLHDLFSTPVFLGLPVAALAEAGSAARCGQRGWAGASAGCGVGTLVAFGLASAGFAQSPALVDRAGLLQRLSVSAGFGWLTALCWRALRTRPS